jgi:glutaredoxin
MVSERGLLIRTVVVDGTEESFKTALRRSILGVTFRKNKRYGNEFYQHKIHNIAVIEQLCKWLYEYLLAETPLKNMSQFKVKTELFIKWSQTGKILGASNIKTSIYLKMGDLSVKDITIFEEHEKIKVDFFFSNIDAASPIVKEQLLKMKEDLGEENFDYKEYNFQNDEDRKTAVSYGVNRVPTVVINDEKIENPNERDLRSKIEAAFTTQIEVKGANFMLEPNTDAVVEKLASKIRTYETKT